GLSITGAGQLRAVAGESGSGKTRFIVELRAVAHSRDVRVLGGRMSDRDRGFPYQAYCEAIQEYFAKSSDAQHTPLADQAHDLVTLFPTLGDIPALRAYLTPVETPHEPTD